MTGILSPEKVMERLSKVAGFDKVRFVILYGSRVRGGARPESDIDICIYFDGSPNEASDFRFRVLSVLPGGPYDVQISRQLPLYVRVGVLKGKVLFVTDERLLYDVARETIRDFDDFSHRYYDYIGEKAIS